MDHIRQQAAKIESNPLYHSFPASSRFMPACKRFHLLHKQLPWRFNKRI
jgi:hypothetical protein